MVYLGVKPHGFLAPMEKSLELSVLAKLKPPPVMMDFAAEEQRRRSRGEALPPGGGAR
jgi:hypothetical protein